MTDDSDYIEIGEARRQRRAAHSPFIVNGLPADLQPLPTIDPLTWDGAPVPERRWIVPGIIPEGNVVMLGGDGGNGKSLLAIQLLAACALGKGWLGREARPCKAVGIFCEDDRDELHRRVADVVRFYGASFGDLEHLSLLSRVGEDNALMTFGRDWEPGEFSMLYARIENLVTTFGAELLVLDSLHDLFPGNENSRPQARQFIGALRRLAMTMRGAVLLTAHPSLSGRNSGTGEAGSTAWNNAVRSRLYLTAPHAEDGDAPDRDYRELRIKKANYGAAGDTIRLRWRDGVFVREDALGSSGIVESLQLDNDALSGLRSLVQDGALVPADPSAAKSLANAGRRLPILKRYGWAAVKAAQDRLLATGKVERVELGPPSKRRIYIRPAGMAYPGETKEAGK